MNKVKIITLGIVTVMIAVLSNSFVNQVSAAPNLAGRTLIFKDEFNSSPLNTSKWNTCYHWGNDGNGCTSSTNNELEWYMPQNVSISSAGRLWLKAKKQTITGTDGKQYPYTSGIVTTDGKFSYRYGYAEVYAKTPKGKGLWPTFWMMASDHTWPPELDVLEQRGDINKVNFMGIHYKNDDGTNGFTQQTADTTADLTAGYHKYGMEWQPGKVTWYLDGVAKASYINKYKVPSKSMYLILNLAVGGSGPGDPDESTVFPAIFGVDYVRVYK